MATALEEWTKEEVYSVICFLWAEKVPPVENHCKLVAVYGGNIMAAQHMHMWCREFDSAQVNLKDEQMSGRPSTSADPVQDIDATCKQIG
jgi:hypothetical protein